MRKKFCNMASPHQRGKPDLDHKKGITMSDIIKEEEIDQIVSDIIADYDRGKNIDVINIYNRPDKAEVVDLINNLFRVIYPGYFRDRSYKIYNPKSSFAVNIEDIFYHLNKQVFRALDFCTKRGTMTTEENGA